MQVVNPLRQVFKVGDELDDCIVFRFGLGGNELQVFNQTQTIEQERFRYCLDAPNASLPVHFFAEEKAEIEQRFVIEFLIGIPSLQTMRDNAIGFQIIEQQDRRD